MMQATGNAIQNTSNALKIIGVLALLQAALAVMRAVGLFNLGSDFLGRGVAILPLMGLLAYARGFLIAGVALLYAAFAYGLFTRKGWAWPLGVAIAAVNVLLVLSVVVQGDSIIRGIAWLIVPLVVLWYLFSDKGWRTFEP